MQSLQWLLSLLVLLLLLSGEKNYISTVVSTLLFSFLLFDPANQECTCIYHNKCDIENQVHDKCLSV